MKRSRLILRLKELEGQAQRTRSRRKLRRIARRQRRVFAEIAACYLTERWEL